MQNIFDRQNAHNTSLEYPPIIYGFTCWKYIANVFFAEKFQKPIYVRNLTQTISRMFFGK